MYLLYKLISSCSLSKQTVHSTDEFIGNYLIGYAHTQQIASIPANFGSRGCLMG